MKNFSKILNYAHRYLGLLIFLQVILWSFSGFFMYYLDFSDLYDIPPDKPVNLQSNIPDISELKTIIDKKYPKEKILNIMILNLLIKNF